MSEHEQKDHHHESWKAKLSHAFKDLKEADASRDAKLRHNQEAVERIVRDVFPPVFAQFVEDAKGHGFQAGITLQANSKQTLTLQGPTACQFSFWVEASAEAITVMAYRIGGSPVNLLHGKRPEHFQEADLGDYLALELEGIRPKTQ